MAGTRSKRNNATKSSPSAQEKKTAGRKRKASASPSPQAKRGKKVSPKKQQKTLEETMPDMDEDTQNDTEMADAADKTHTTNGNHNIENGGETGTDNSEVPDASDEVEVNKGVTEQENGDEKVVVDKAEYEALKKAQKTDQPVVRDDDASAGDVRPGVTQSNDQKGNGDRPADDNATDADATDQERGNGNTNEQAAGATSRMDETGEVESTQEKTKQVSSPHANGAVEESEEREKVMPSNILEKGIIYFFIRARVNVDAPEGVQDIARTYIVLRPLPYGAKLGEGTLEDTETSRLLALPKKVLPRNHRDLFMTFVEKANTTIKELKDDFMKGSDYSTKTTGTRHTQAVTPVGEGIYAITTTGRETHLAYMLTVPSEIGEVQEEMGLKEKGSFVLSVKNPEQKGPANASLPRGPDFPKEIMEEFRSLRWMPCQPKHLQYANAQFLLIGEGHGELDKAVEPATKDEKHEDKETPLEEMEKLEAEDEIRMQGLEGNEAEAVFADLGISHEEYPKLKTTW